MSNDVLDECLVELKRHGTLSVNLLNKDAVDVLIRRGFARIVHRIDYSNYSVKITEKGRSFEGFAQEEKNQKRNSTYRKWILCISIFSAFFAALNFIGSDVLWRWLCLIINKI